MALRISCSLRWGCGAGAALSSSELSKPGIVESTAQRPPSAVRAPPPTVTCTTGSSVPFFLAGHSWPAAAGAGACRRAAGASGPCVRATGAADSGAAAGAVGGASPAALRATSSTTSCACAWSVSGSGLQVLRSREELVGMARAMRQRQGSGATRFQLSSRLRASRSRHCTSDCRALNCRDCSGRCFELKRSHSFMATLAASSGLSLYCSRHSAVLLSSTVCRARRPSSVGWMSASLDSSMAPDAPVKAKSAFFRQS
mmetsp:Transcript_36272/g.109210  ORF Transcript_36272/g.109210 Transcript_36272/m.109210 type:complete len:257 (-) Transcript_36272:891-1661(-)